MTGRYELSVPFPARGAFGVLTAGGTQGLGPSLIDHRGVGVLAADTAPADGATIVLPLPDGAFPGEPRFRAEPQ